MMDLLKTWIVGITAASVLLAGVKILIPKGSVKQVGELACGLVLMLVIAAPLARLDMSELSLALTEFRMVDMKSADLLKIENGELIKEIIEEKTAAYISDKATELGMDCVAQVTYEYTQEGQAYPVSVVVKGEWNETQREQLALFIESNLAVSKDNQAYVKENDP